MNTRLFVLGMAAICFCAAPAMAEMTVQQIFDEITVNPNLPHTDPTDIYQSNVNAATGKLPDSLDSLWQITASGGSVATMVIEIAGNATSNNFGVFEAGAPGNGVQIFDGLISPGGPAGVATLSLFIGGSGGFDVYVNGNYMDNWDTPVFGYYLQGPGGTFYSSSGLNPASEDHMWAYAGVGDWVQFANIPASPWISSEYILAWEDVSAAGGSDFDYNDMLVMVESVIPVPVPAAVLLGVLGLGAAGIRLRKHV